jgi:hypothetical protein
MERGAKQRLRIPICNEGLPRGMVTVLHGPVFHVSWGYRPPFSSRLACFLRIVRCQSRQPSCIASHTISGVSLVPTLFLLRLAVGVSANLSIRFEHLTQLVAFTVLYAAIISCSCQHSASDIPHSSYVEDNHTSRYLKSFACGRDCTHRVMAKNGSTVPKHSALSLCRPFASRSITTWNCRCRLPATNLNYKIVSGRKRMICKYVRADLDCRLS